MDSTRVRAVIYDRTTGPVPGFETNYSLSRFKIITRHISWYTSFSKGEKDYYASGCKDLCNEAEELLTALGAKIIISPRVIRERG